MGHEVESMFSTRVTPWHGLGTIVNEALNSREALREAGLDWDVIQKPVYTQMHNFQHDIQLMKGYKANIRSTDDAILGLVTDSYKVVQNREAFEFTDNLLGEEVRYETAGSLFGGSKIWLLAKLPPMSILGDSIDPYLVFTNSHDGKGAIKVAITPIRVVCNNTLNLALNTTKRQWSTKHIGDIQTKLNEAEQTLTLSNNYLTSLVAEAERLIDMKLSRDDVDSFINELLPISDKDGTIKQNNITSLQDDLRIRYYQAPDLRKFDSNCWKMMNAVSDFATHIKPLRTNSNHKESSFSKTIEGNPIIDEAYQIINDMILV
jgi:phage/plasmid-like protein (TIGR03299 family)